MKRMADILGGSLSLMLSYLVKSGSVSGDDINELHNILNRLEESDPDA